MRRLPAWSGWLAASLLLVLGAQKPPPEKVTALEVVDAAGVVRIALAVDDEGTASVEVRDARGRRRASVGVLGGGGGHGGVPSVLLYRDDEAIAGGFTGDGRSVAICARGPDAHPDRDWPLKVLPLHLWIGGAVRAAFFPPAR